MVEDVDLQYIVKSIVWEVNHHKWNVFSDRKTHELVSSTADGKGVYAKVGGGVSSSYVGLHFKEESFSVHEKEAQ